jgi:uncharacterized membrane protein YhdT
LSQRYTDGRTKAAWGLGLGIAATTVYAIVWLIIFSAL